MRLKYIFYLIPLLVWGCKKDQDISAFDTGQSYIYFAVENPDRSSSKTQLYIDSLDFSFIFEEESTQEKTLAIPVNIIGEGKSVDRKYTVTVNDALTTIDRSIITLSEPTIHANKMIDTLYIKVRRDEKLQHGIYYLVLDLQANSEFQLGHNYNTRLRISITDQMLEPGWWKRWVNVFGQYHREVYRIWMDIYYEGADPTPTNDEEQSLYYWNNMPYSPSPSWYPVTYMYIDKLKKHLENVPVYPGGDATKPRIYLP